MYHFVKIKKMATIINDLTNISGFIIHSVKECKDIFNNDDYLKILNFCNGYDGVEDMFVVFAHDADENKHEMVTWYDNDPGFGDPETVADDITTYINFRVLGKEKDISSVSKNENINNFNIFGN